MKIYQCAIANRRYFPLASAKLQRDFIPPKHFKKKFNKKLLFLKIWTNFEIKSLQNAMKTRKNRTKAFTQPISCYFNIIFQQELKTERYSYIIYRKLKSMYRKKTNIFC